MFAGRDSLPLRFFGLREAERIFAGADGFESSSILSVSKLMLMAVGTFESHARLRPLSCFVLHRLNSEDSDFIVIPWLNVNSSGSEVPIGGVIGSHENRSAREELRVERLG